MFLWNLYSLFYKGNAKCRNNDVWNRGGNICFRQYNSSSMITSGEAKNRCNALRSDLLIIDTMQKQMFSKTITETLVSFTGLNNLFYCSNTHVLRVVRQHNLNVAADITKKTPTISLWLKLYQRLTCVWLLLHLRNRFYILLYIINRYRNTKTKCILYRFIACIGRSVRQIVWRHLDLG